MVKIKGIEGKINLPPKDYEPPKINQEHTYPLPKEGKK